MPKKVKKQNGGASTFLSSRPSIKLIGNGAYGCAISPPVTTNMINMIQVFKNYSNEKSDDVGKLFKNTESSRIDFDKEKKNAIIANSFDPDGIFTVKIKGSNEINGKYLSNEIRKCIGAMDINEIIYQIIFENGGIPLDKIEDKSMSMLEFVEKVSQFLTGIKMMQDYGICHRDIKSDNVLMSNEKINLIDFGLSGELNNVFSEENERILQHISTIYPPEFYIAGLLIQTKNDKIQFRNSLGDVIDRMEQEKFDSSGIDSEGIEYHEKQNYFEILFEENVIDSLKDDIKEFLREIRINNFSFSEVFDAEMAKKCDIYSLFYILKELSKKVKITNDIQQREIETLLMMCKKFNPYKRATIEDLISFLEDMEENAKYEVYGGKARRCLKIPKIHNDKCNSERVKGYKCKLSNIIKKNIKLL
jgi:serine/threonine protein kinase